MIISNCKQCGGEFYKNRVDKQFCNPNCYRKWGKKNLSHSKGNSETIKKRNRERLKAKRQPYRIYLKPSCQQCGFIPEHTCQLDIDHIDGNHYNNNISNLQTLCANCHRLKSYLNNDHIKENPQGT